MAESTRERLTEAVLLSVREHGYAGTGMQDLLRDSGVSSSSLYHFFPGGKEELVATAVRSAGLDAADRIAEVFRHFEPAEAVERIFEAAAAEMEGNHFALGCPIGVPATEAAADSPVIRDAVDDVFTAWTAAYTDGLRAGGVDADLTARLGRFVVAAYEGSVTLARATRSTEPYRDAIAVITAQLTQAS